MAEKKGSKAKRANWTKEAIAERDAFEAKIMAEQKKKYEAKNKKK